MSEVKRYASYQRVSTGNQESGEASQHGSIREWFKERDISMSEVDQFVDRDRSGSDLSREQFLELMENVRDGKYDAVVMTEISRIARKLSASADFIDAAVKTETPIYLRDEMIDCIDPDDPMSHFFAKQLALWYEEEAKQTRRRINRGLAQTQREGKWTGKTPTGFTTDDNGYLIVDDEEFAAIRAAMLRVEDGESQRSVEEDIPISRQALSSLMEDHRDRYVEGKEYVEDAEEGTDERRRRRLVQEALDEYYGGDNE
ncbi:recombinase family protein [Halopiger aswanensis]|uniref:DNA invertase Pin-like site-specific DNA recombinase n=1 Tax=Halopiger aswanensis TaxID=148449 RepID=A0A419WQV3_9EURY|nr:recombinase family protein [Halopiger aswanensis]RKD97825.1 DNA invertase Pin-like site-specific DNA recombinase [Halopiger aswanensis]